MPDNILVSYFQLHPNSSLNAVAKSIAARPGFLIQVDGGYASVFPWPEFGDEPLEQHIKSLLPDHSKTNLVTAALHFAEVDAHERKRGKSVFENLAIPKSHRLFSALITEKSDTIKIKLHGHIEKDLTTIQSAAAISSTLRLDANASYSFNEFVSLWSFISPSIKKQIEFIEDPIPYDSITWGALANKYAVPLAFDFYSSSMIGEHYNVRIIKPAVQHYQSLAEEEIARGRMIVVTSTMDHPLGVSAAAWVSGILAAKYPQQVLTGGYSSFSAYEEDAFSIEIKGKDGLFTPAYGTGFGFDTLLNKLCWEKLS